MPRFTADHTNPMVKQLTPAIFKSLHSKQTTSGCTFSDVIRAGVDNGKSRTGCIAGDEESWTVFKALLDPVVHAYHDFDPAKHQA